MFANLFFLKRYGRLQSQDNIPLSQLGSMPTALRARIIPDGDNLQGRKYWNFLCYFLHAFLVVLHLILLVVATSDHAEHRIEVPYANATWTTKLSAGLQAFYTLYSALLVFVTQRLMLSAVFSRPKKLTQIHDICGAWAGLGAALSSLWQQTKVASSVFSIVLVAAYFGCISALHVTSSTLMQFQPSNRTTMDIFPALSTWPDASVDLASLDWMPVTPLVPFLQNFYPNRTFGLDNDTLYDTPYVGFITGRVHAMTLNANCGLLTNLSINALENNTWNVNASMSGLDPVSITVSYPPLLDEIWFSPSIECLEPICSTFILYLVSAEIEVDDTSGGINHVYINGTYYSPGGATPNFSSPIYFVACSLNATNHTITLDSSGYPLGSSKPANAGSAAWSAFSPAGDSNLTSAISYAMKSADSLPPSPYCQPIMSDPALWANITALNAYMRSALGMGVSPCYGVPIAQYTSSPSSLTRNQFESTVAQITAEFIWLAGQLGKPAGGFDRQELEYPMLMTELSYRLNINILPVIFALCASLILLVLVLYVLWGHPMTVISGDGVLEIMWFGSCSRVLRDQLSGVKTPSLDVLRASAMFETIFWARAAYGHEENNDLYTAATLRDQNPHSRGFGTWGLSESESGNSRSTSNISHTRHWCYALHAVLVALHIALLALLVYHPEESIVILYESDTTTIGLSALLQTIYTLYSALLVLLMQRLAVFKIVSERRKLTTVHDISKAWTGIGAAIHILWQQRQGSSSTREILAVGVYLIMMLVLHITSSSIMQWQWDPVSLRVDVDVQTNLAMPDSAMNISQLGWTEIFPIVRLVQDADLSTLGLSNSTIYDVQQGDDTTITGLVNATTLTAQCGLLPNLTVSYQNSDEEYQINFQNGINSGSFLESPIWKDVVHVIVPNAECVACAQTLFYLITTELDVDESVQDPVAVGLNWTYTPSGGNPQTSTTVTYIAACSLSAQTILASPSDPLGDQAPQSTNTSWSTWAPGNATNLSLGMAAALSNDAAVSFTVFFQGNYFANFTDMDSYIMSLLGLNLTYANETSVSQSSANPSEALSPWQLENAVAQTAAAFLWTAGQVGESGGGFQRSMGETQGMYLASPWRLHLNTIPVLFASIASFVSLILAMIIIGKGPSGEHPVSISGTSVLECLWLEAQSEQLHSRLQTVEAPRLDALRAAGMFDVRLGDIGRAGYAEMERPILESVDG